MSRSGHVYTPSDTKAYEQAIRHAWSAEHAAQGFSGAVAVVLQFIFARPKSHYLRGALRPTAPAHFLQVPDLDNVEKAVLDALNKVAYVDDKQIIGKVTLKTWGPENLIRLTVMEVD